MKRRSPKACARTLALHAFIDVPTAFCPGYWLAEGCGGYLRSMYGDEGVSPMLC